MRSFSHRRSQSHTTTHSNSHSPSSSVISLSTLSLASPNIFNNINLNRSPSTNNNNTGNTTSTTHINGLDSHSYSQLLKKLDQALSKFNNLKKNSTSKTNILRLVLLPYLRYPLNYISDANEFCSLIDLDLDLIILESNILLSWWSTLLHILTNDYTNIPSLDKKCYFESISRLISYSLWFFIEENHTNNNSNITSQIKSLNEISSKFNQLLLQTFEFSILKLNSKNINLSLNAFIGKIFVNCFFKLPDISRGLSFLLNTKVKNFKLIYNISILNSLSSTIDFNSSDVLFNGFPNVLNEVADALPNHLAPLISSTIKPRSFNFIIEKNFMNSINPPKEKINGIKETKGIWVNRWSSLDNIDLFISFFRHYLSISSIYLRKTPDVLFNNYYVYGLPGFLCCITHIYEILNFQILNKIKLQAAKNNNNGNNYNNNNNNINVSFSNPLLIIPPTIPIELPSDKILKVLRDFLINPLNDYEMFLKNGVIKSFENVLKLLISKTKIFENLNIELIFEIFINFIKSIKTFNEIDSIDWMFWINVLIKLLNCKNINCELKSICIFYELWDYIPINLYLDDENILENEFSNFNNWFSDSKKNLKFNLTIYLLSEDNWLQFFGHYMPLVRSLYIKLLIWKILGIDSIGIEVESSGLDENNNVENEIENQFNYKNLANKKIVLDLIESKLTKTFKLTKDIKFKPVDPVLNKKFSILKIYLDDDKKKEKRLRGYPFEILDDAVYSAMNNSLTNSNNTATSSPAPTLTLTPPSSSNQLSPSTAPNSKTSNKFSSSWVGKIFHKKSDDIDSNKINSKWPKFTSNNLSNNLSANLNHLNNSNENIGTSPPSPLFSKTPSSMTSLSSLQSSLSSSNDLPEKSLNSNPNINLNNSCFNVSQPPELLNKSIELQNSNYEFQLVNNDLKILNFIQTLNNLNQENNKFCKINDILIYNFRPKLPVLKCSRNKQNIRLDSLNSDIDTDSELHSEIHSDIDVGINDDEIGDDIDLTGGFGEVEGIDFVINPELNTHKNKINEKKIPPSEITSIMMNFCNSIKEYNSSILEFEKFIELRLKDFDPDELNIISPQSTTIWSENNLVDTDESNSVLDINFIPHHHHTHHSHKNKAQLKLSKENFKKLSLQIPNIIPELPGDKLNGY